MAGQQLWSAAVWIGEEVDRRTPLPRPGGCSCRLLLLLFAFGTSRRDCPGNVVVSRLPPALAEDVVFLVSIGFRDGQHYAAEGQHNLTVWHPATEEAHGQRGQWGVI